MQKLVKSFYAIKISPPLKGSENWNKYSTAINLQKKQRSCYIDSRIEQELSKQKLKS